VGDKSEKHGCGEVALLLQERKWREKATRKGSSKADGTLRSR
jgi:hypothetical protein